MEIAVLNGYSVWMPLSGGKAGRGRNKTGSIQVRKNGIILKQFRFKCDNPMTTVQNGRDAARKAREFILGLKS